MQRQFAWLTTLMLVAVPLGPVATMTARAAPLPTDDTTPTLVKHVVTDLDGDGRRDSVTLNYLGSDRFQLVVTTVKGKTSKVTFRSQVDAKWAPAADTWYGASAIDGRKGSELIVNLFTKRSAADRNNVKLAVYTWRSGKLVAEKAPATPTGKVWTVNASRAAEARGYNFFTRSGHRYVDAVRMTTGKYTTPWKGYITRSVWRNGKWVKVKTRRAATVKSLMDWRQVSISGPHLLLGQVSVDVDGDAQADLVSFYRTNLSDYLVRVATATRTVESDIHSIEADPFIGAAELDGTAGSELMFALALDVPSWRVLTWRDGFLTDLRAPKVSGGVGNFTQWVGVNDESVTNFAFSVENGTHYATTGYINDEDLPDGSVKWVKSVWQPGSDGSWAEVAESTTPLTAEQKAAFHNGFTAPGLVSP